METRKIDLLLKELQNGVQEVFESDKYKTWLLALSHLYRYSWGNSILILSQMAGATIVNSYDRWKKLGRHVCANQRGIKILVPVQVKVKNNDKETDDNEEERTILRFKVGHVWDISQTEGDPLPSPCNELQGTVDGYNRFIEVAKTISPVPVSFEELSGSAKGFFDPVGDRIVVKTGLSERQTAKTLLHEIVHSKLHNKDRLKVEGNKSRERMEVEAESVAFVTMNTILGIDSSDYSFGYVASWSHDKETKELTDCLSVIRDTSAELITDFENALKQEVSA